jgi:hypothetical protein
LAEPGSDRAKAFARRPALPPGRYLLKVYLNMTIGWRKTQVEIARAVWREGYGQMTVAEARRVRK